MPDFVLHGTPAMNFKEQMIDDLKYSIEVRLISRNIYSVIKVLTFEIVY